MQLPLFLPASTWRPPASLPPIEGPFAIDLETKDPNLKERGPGYKRRDGYITGFALANEHHQCYLPIKHEDGDNLPPNVVINYIRRLIEQAPYIVTANGSYDVGWLVADGITQLSNFPRIFDVQVAEALLDEEQLSYSLDNIAKSYGLPPKDETLLREAANAYEMVNKGQFNPKADMWRLSARYVGKYAEQDAALTWKLHTIQSTAIEKEGLQQVFQLESEVLPILVDMSLKGVPVNLAAAEELADKLRKRESELHSKYGSLDVWSSQQLAEYFRSKGIPVPQTAKGNDSLTKGYLESLDLPIAKEILELRGLNRLRKVYIEDTILKGHFNGRVHCDFKQTTSDEGGTRSGRLSSQNPNLQQVPKRSGFGKLIRNLYIAEPDHLWCSADYSSQEPRLQVHYALLMNLTGAKEAAQAFADGTKLYTFFEQATSLPYNICKMLCLGISYGMGLPTMAEQINMSQNQCRMVLDKFTAKAPFLRMLFDRAMGSAQEKGYIKTIYGRKSRFDFWTPSFEEAPVKGLKNARVKFGANTRLQRAFVSKALNRLIQGSAADQTKLAMVNAYKAGIDLRLPVHDELNAMVANEQQANQLKEIMETAITLHPPLTAAVDMDIGKSW